jgi:hypothetical protein
LAVPPGLQIIMGEMWTRGGAVRVHYSEVDNDDTLAAYAYVHGASVMSMDKDFFRYKDMNY